MSDTKHKPLPHTRLAEGEVTGHFHEAVGLGTVLYEDFTLDAPHGAEVNHQEHGTVTIPPGVYERGLVQEVNEDEELRAVID